MSQSPIGRFSEEGLTRYRQGWKALNRLLHESRSFSGNEKDCAFLNLRNGKFASVSAVTGLNFNDDGRAAAVCDWNFDGKLDLWLSARTAPRLRYVQNQFTSVGQFLAVQLQGTGTKTNRDAIGARVEVLVKDGSKLIATLHAGDGFLAQSSRWMHFGLGETTTVESIRVHWPGGGWETYPGVPANGFYLIRQGAGGAQKWDPPQREFKAINSELPKSSLSIRTVLPYRLRLPDIDLEGDTMGKLEIDGPTLLTVWSTSCNHCISELQAWSKQADVFEQRGLPVLALQADRPRTEKLNQATQQLLQRIGFAFTSQSPTENSLRRLDFLQRAVMDLWQPMPVPCTFLLDRWQRVAVIYKGPVSVQQIVDDLKLLDANFDELRQAGLPFNGRWAGPEPEANPMRVTAQFIDHQLLPDAVNYLDQFLATVQSTQDSASQNATASTPTMSPTRQADIHFVRSVLLESMGRSDDAFAALQTCKALNSRDHRFRVALAKVYLQRKDVDHAIEELSAAVAIDPQDIDSRRKLASLFASRQELSAAIEQFKALTRLTPDDTAAHFNLGTMYHNSGDVSQAVTSYRNAWQQRPDFIPAGNNLAWVLATYPDKTLRSGKEAVEVAKSLCDRTRYLNPRLLDTLAAAYAEDGNFTEAVKTIEKAIDLLRANGEEDTAEMQSRLEQYRQEKPHRSR